MTILLWILIPPLIVYAMRAAEGRHEKFTKLSRISRFIFISLVLLFAGLLAIENANYYLVGYRSTLIVYLLTTLAGIVYVLADRRFILSSMKRTILNLVAVVFMMGALVTTITLVGDFKRGLVYFDSKFRLEFSAAPMSRCGVPTLFVKKGFLERKTELVTDDTCISKQDISSVSIKDMDSVYIVRYIIKNADSNILQPLVVKYRRP